jgi:hypothetical protein
MHPLDRLQDVYQQLGKQNLHLLNEVYARNIRFSDPFHDIHGLDALKAYFGKLYENVADCRFVFGHRLQEGRRASLEWTMTLKHPRLNGGRPLSVEGISVLEFEERIHYHRDYFDAGAMLYERLPLLGGMVRLVKSRLA